MALIPSESLAQGLRQVDNETANYEGGTKNQGEAAATQIGRFMGDYGDHFSFLWPEKRERESNEKKLFSALAAIGNCAVTLYRSQSYSIAWHRVISAPILNS